MTGEMRYRHDKHHRRSIRLSVYDYSQNGAYFVSICTKNRECLFGEIEKGEMRLNDAGQIVFEEWMKTAEIRSNIELDACVVMPNHIHGIIVIEGRGTARRAPTVERFGQPVPGSIPTVIRSFKSAVTKRINEMRQTPALQLWQRNYYEHIIRNDDDLSRIRQYIIDNPTRWDMDRENPKAGYAPISGHDLR